MKWSSLKGDENRLLHYHLQVLHYRYEMILAKRGRKLCDNMVWLLALIVGYEMILAKRGRKHFRCINNHLKPSDMKWSSLKGDENRFKGVVGLTFIVIDMKWSSLKGDENHLLKGWLTYARSIDMKWSSLKGDENVMIVFILITSLFFDMKWSSLKGDENLIECFSRTQHTHPIWNDPR